MKHIGPILLASNGRLNEWTSKVNSRPVGGNFQVERASVREASADYAKWQLVKRFLKAPLKVVPKSTFERVL